MKNKRIFILALSFILILTVSLIPTGLNIAASASDFDYSRPGSNNAIFTSADLLEYIGIELSEAERDYLKANGTFKLSYECVTSSQITVVNIDDTTQITARPYSYVATNGKTVTWIPKSINLGGVTGELTADNGVYVSTFNSTSLSEDATVDVTYELQGIASIPADAINEVINLAYLKALEIGAKFESYETAKNAYDTYYADNREAVDRYLSDLDKYNQYLRDQRIYEDKKEVYDKYITDLDQYNKDLKEYNQYLSDLDAYNTYLENVEKYNEDYAKYQEYSSQINVVREQIKVLDDGLFVKATYLKRQLYSSLFSSLVDEVIGANKQLYITMLGIDGNVIDDCVEASNEIRGILEPDNGIIYKKLLTEEEKYDFYCTNRNDLRDAIIKLTRALYELYCNERLRDMMHIAPTLVGRSDYTEKLSIFISQLILFSNALSDEPVMSYDGTAVLDQNTTFSYWNEAGQEIKNRKAIDVLEGNDYIKDSGNAAPLKSGYPTEVEEPVAPDTVDSPTPIQPPILPEAVEEPVKPEVIAEPTPPVGFVFEPQKPAEYGDTIYTQLVSELESNALTERVGVSDDVSYVPSITLTKSIYSSDAVTVTFTDGKGGVVSEISVDKGSAVNFTGELPTKAEDLGATYTFYAWEDSDGNIFDLSKVDRDVTLYPVFQQNKKDNVKIESNGNGKNIITLSIENMTLEQLPVTGFAELANEHLADLLVKAENVTVSMTYGALMELDGAGVSYLDVNLDTSTVGEYIFDLIAMNSENEPVDSSAPVKVFIPCSDEFFGKESKLTYSNNGKIENVKKDYSNGIITYTAQPGRSYSLALKYGINLYTSIKDVVSAPDGFVPGQTVHLELNVPLGYSLELYYILSSDPNTKHPIENGTFVMPYENINLGGRLITLEYTVIFVSDGKEIYNKVYKYGDTVRIPNDPIKISDAEYSYKFVGWSPEITTVTRDVTYVAQYERIPLPEEPTPFPWLIVLLCSFITLFTLGVFALVIIILDKKGIISVKKIARSVKHKLTRSATNKPQEDVIQLSSSPETVQNATIEPVSVCAETEENAENTEFGPESAVKDEENENTDSECEINGENI